MPTTSYAHTLTSCYRAFRVAVLLLTTAPPSLFAEDWGAYSFVPVSAPALMMHAADPGAEGAVISINKPDGSANQKWVIIPKGENFYGIKPSVNSPLTLAASQGGTRNGTSIVLEKESGQPWQMWAMERQEDGSYKLLPRHTAAMALDDLGGNQTPGTPLDIWENKQGDQHLHFIIKPLAGSPPSAASNVESSYIPTNIDPKDILKGEVKSMKFDQSAIFPGTVRTVNVFIPAQYVAAKPACVYVKTDGFNPREKELMERMIATKEMPITVGVFVTPGELPAPVPGNLGRRNRCLEYDGMGDANVRFLVDELLPFVARELKLNISTNGTDRCIAGGSSGGIAAFNAAWERPEAFSRVYANSGSFVAFRGGHEFPTLVRKYEAKPIRAYLTTGTHDMENCAGDWFLLDQEMDKAMKFSGYDYFFRSITGGHVAGFYDYYQEAMAYLWKGWPEPVKAGPSAPRARDVLLPNEGWQLMSEGRHGGCGPACNASGEVFFTEPGDNKISRIALDGSIQNFLTDSGKANSITFGADGKLYAASKDTGIIMCYDATGKGVEVVSGIHGEHIMAAPNGGLYVTSNEAEVATVWFVKDGKKTQVGSGMKFATGLAFRPDQWLLSVADGHSKWAGSYQMNPDGTLTNPERFFWLHVAEGDDDAGAESICYAREGQMFVATRMGIQICADDGPTQVILPTPDHHRVTGVCLGGKEMDTLFAFSGDKIWKRKVKVHANGAFSPQVKVKGTGL